LYTKHECNAGKVSANVKKMPADFRAALKSVYQALTSEGMDFGSDAGIVWTACMHELI